MDPWIIVIIVVGLSVLFGLTMLIETPRAMRASYERGRKNPIRTQDLSEAWAELDRQATPSEGWDITVGRTTRKGTTHYWANAHRWGQREDGTVYPLVLSAEKCASPAMAATRLARDPRWGQREKP